MIFEVVVVELFLQLLRKSKRTRPADPIRQLLRDHVLINRVTRGAADPQIALKKRLLSLSQNLLQQNRLELPCRLRNLFLLVDLGGSGELLQREIRCRYTSIE